jgi:dienelactone hydrolase
LTASLDTAAALAVPSRPVPVVVVGWSLGGRAALSLALDPGSAPRVAGVVGLAAGLRGPSPLDGAIPLERVLGGVTHEPPPMYLVHGRQDAVVPAAGAREFAEACRKAGIRCSLVLVDSDHAGVVGTVYDSDLRRCVADDGPAARNGLEAALDAVRAAVASSP